MMKVNDPAALAELKQAFEAYETALMANDIESLDALFWDAPQALRYGVGENLYGYAAIAQFRRDRPGGSPPRVLFNTVLTTFGADVGTANTEFRRDASAKIGRQSQTWIRTNDGWKIAAAHVSIMGDDH